MVKRKEVIFVTLLIFIGVATGMLQTVIDILATPSGKVFPLVHNYAADYYAYLSIMRQGFDGMWLATSRLTPENFPPQLIDVFLLFLGHLARWTGLTLPTVYTLARISGGLCLLLLTYVLICLVYPVSSLKRLTALMLVIFGTYFWGWEKGFPTVPNLTHLWTEFDPMVRLSYVPHQLWAKVFMLSSFILLISAEHKAYRLMFLAIAILLMGLSSPVALLTFIPTIFLWAFWEFGKNFLDNKSLRGLPVAPFLVAAVISLILAWYSRAVETGVFPWNSYKIWEESVRYPITFISYLQSLGPNFILFLIAIFAVQWKTTSGPLLAAWSFSGWIMVFGLGARLPIANIRFLEGYQFIPVSILAAEGLFFIAKKISADKKKIQGRVIAVILTFIIFYAVIGCIASLREHLHYLAGDIYDERIYVPEPEIGALTALNQNSVQNAVVMAPPEVSTMVPAFTSDRVIAGHALYTFEKDNKENELAAFYSYRDLSAARNILQKYHVSLVWFNNNDLPDNYFLSTLGLTRVFYNAAATIYKVRDIL